MTTTKVKLPPKLVKVFAPARGAVQYRGSRGGRGSGKSFNFALMAAIWGYAEPMRILCTREYQVSIKESFHAELKAAIGMYPWLQAHYDVGIDYLRGVNGTEFIFRGLRRNEQSIKSLAKIDLTIVEEAEDVPESSWLSLEATVFRRPKSELWAIWNPRTDGSPVDMRFVKDPPHNGVFVEQNWYDNPFFPPGLDTLRRREKRRLDQNTYEHVWEGAYLTRSKSQVLGGKWTVEEFTPGKDWDGPYQGGDFGFAQDPTAAVRCWVYDERLWVEYEAGEVGLELDDTGEFMCERIPGFDQVVTRWDSARPESISHLRKPRQHRDDKRVPLPRSEAVAKWSGSLEDGIQFLRSFKQIVIHPRCKETIREARLYSYKVDRLTGDVTADVIDAWNHYIDALRYAVTPMIKRGKAAAVLLKRKHRT